MIYPLSGMRKEAAAWQKLWQTVGRSSAANYIRNALKRRGSTGLLPLLPQTKIGIRQGALMTGIKDTNNAYKDRLLSAVETINKNREKRYFQRLADKQKQVMRSPTRQNLDELAALEKTDPNPTPFKLRPFENQDKQEFRKIVGTPDTYPAEQVLGDKTAWKHLSTFGRTWAHDPPLRGVVTIPKTSPIQREAYPQKLPKDLHY